MCVRPLRCWRSLANQPLESQDSLIRRRRDKGKRTVRRDPPAFFDRRLQTGGSGLPPSSDLKTWLGPLRSGLCVLLSTCVFGSCSWVIAETDPGREERKVEEVRHQIGLPFDPVTVSTERPPNDSRGKPNSVTIIATRSQSVPWSDLTATLSAWLSSAGFKVEMVGTCVVFGARREPDGGGAWSVTVEASPTWGPTPDYQCAGPVNAVKLRFVARRA